MHQTFYLKQKSGTELFLYSKHWQPGNNCQTNHNPTSNHSTTKSMTYLRDETSGDAKMSSCDGERMTSSEGKRSSSLFLNIHK